QTCANGCSQGSCCLSNAQYCQSGRQCDETESYCGHEPFNCSTEFGTCAARFPGTPYTCMMNRCACTPGTTGTDPCDESSCDADGNWTSATCNACCCNGEICTTALICQHANGVCQ